MRIPTREQMQQLLLLMLFPSASGQGVCVPGVQALTTSVNHEVSSCSMFNGTTEGGDKPVVNLGTDDPYVCCHADFEGDNGDPRPLCASHWNFLHCRTNCDPQAQKYTIFNGSQEDKNVNMSPEFCYSLYLACIADLAGPGASGDHKKWCEQYSNDSPESLKLPDSLCPEQCNGNGGCDFTISKPKKGCNCNGGYIGDACEWFNIQYEDGIVRGFCHVNEKDKCDCDFGYFTIWKEEPCVFSLVNHVLAPLVCLGFVLFCIQMQRTKHHVKSAAEKTAHATMQNKDVIDAVLAKNYPPELVHKCVKDFYMKNPSFVKIDEASLVKLCDQRQATRDMPARQRIVQSAARKAGVARPVAMVEAAPQPKGFKKSGLLEGVKILQAEEGGTDFTRLKLLVMGAPNMGVQDRKKIIELMEKGLGINTEAKQQKSVLNLFGTQIKDQDRGVDKLEKMMEFGDKKTKHVEALDGPPKKKSSRYLTGNLEVDKVNRDLVALASEKRYPTRVTWACIREYYEEKGHKAHDLPMPQVELAMRLQHKRNDAAATRIQSLHRGNKGRVVASAQEELKAQQQFSPKRGAKGGFGAMAQLAKEKGSGAG